MPSTDSSGWRESPAVPANGSDLRVAVLGADQEENEDTDSWFQGTGVETECHLDLAELERTLELGAPAPEVVLVKAADLVAAKAQTTDGGEHAPTVGGDLGLAQSVHRGARTVLELLQAWIASEGLAQSRLVLVTDGALAVGDEEIPNLAEAALVGLMRSAQTEHPERFGLIDLGAGGGSCRHAARCPSRRVRLRAGAQTGHAVRAARGPCEQRRRGGHKRCIRPHPARS